MRGLTPRDGANYEDDDGVVHAIGWVSHHDDYTMWLACGPEIRAWTRDTQPRRLVDPSERPVDCLSCLVATIMR